MKYEVGEYVLNVEIVKKNNKNTYIRLKDINTIYVTTNYFTSKNYIKKLLDNNKDFLIKMINKYQKNAEKNKQFYLLGVCYSVVTSSNFKKIEIDHENKTLYVKDEKMLTKWLNIYMNDIYLNRLNKIYNQFEENIPYPKLKIRNMKTRWGVCNRSNNTVTLNSKLIRYELEMLDYVIVHELSHFVQFDHSKKFWSIVGKYCHDYKNLRKKLNE